MRSETSYFQTFGEQVYLPSNNLVLSILSINLIQGSTSNIVAVCEALLKRLIVLIFFNTMTVIFTKRARKGQWSHLLCKVIWMRKSASAPSREKTIKDTRRGKYFALNQLTKCAGISISDSKAQFRKGLPQRVVILNDNPKQLTFKENLQTTREQKINK